MLIVVLIWISERCTL